MYCSSCGVAVAQNLTYCNNCGAKLTSDRNSIRATELRAEWAVMSSMAALFVCGLVAMSVLLGVMKAVLRFEAGQLMAFAFLSFLILIGLEIVYISRLFKFRRDSESSPDKQRPTSITKELEAKSRGFGEPVASVTDQTTRTLDPIYSERESPAAGR